jgi:hypothetical protein
VLGKPGGENRPGNASGWWKQCPPAEDIFDYYCQEHDWVYTHHKCAGRNFFDETCNSADRKFCKNTLLTDCSKAKYKEQCPKFKEPVKDACNLLEHIKGIEY